MARGFHAMDAVIPWDTGVLGALLATRHHSQQAHLPWSRGQPLAPSLQATQSAYLFVWIQAEQEHAWPYMPQDAELLSLAAKHPDRSPSAATQGQTILGCFRVGQTQPVTWGSQGHHQKVCPEWHIDFPFFHNEPLSLLNTALSPNCLQLFYCP